MRSVAKIVAITLEIIFTLLAIASVNNVAHSGQWTVSTWIVLARLAASRHTVSSLFKFHAES